MNKKYFIKNQIHRKNVNVDEDSAWGNRIYFWLNKMDNEVTATI